MRAGALSAAAASRAGSTSAGGACRAPAACWCARTIVASAATAHALPCRLVAASPQAGPGSSPRSRPLTSGDAGYTRSSSYRTAPGGPATGIPSGRGRTPRRSPAGDHSTDAPAADDAAAKAPAGTTPHHSRSCRLIRSSSTAQSKRKQSTKIYRTRPSRTDGIGLRIRRPGSSPSECLGEVSGQDCRHVSALRANHVELVALTWLMRDRVSLTGREGLVFAAGA